MDPSDSDCENQPIAGAARAVAGFGRRSRRPLHRGVPSVTGDPPVASGTVEAGPRAGNPDADPWRLALSYAKAWIAAFAVLFLLGTGFMVFGQPVAVSPMRLVTAACFGWVFGVPLLPVVMGFIVVVRALGIPRGYGDVLVGALVGSLMLVFQLWTEGRVTAWALKLIVSGAFGGFAFWRAEGYPGVARDARPGVDAAHGGLKRGLWIGSRMWR